MSENLSAVAADTERYLLPWYLSGTLSPRERRRITEHLAVCAACRCDLETLASLGAQLRRTGQVTPQPSPRAVVAVRSRIQAHAAAANS